MPAKITVRNKSREHDAGNQWSGSRVMPFRTQTCEQNKNLFAQVLFGCECNRVGSDHEQLQIPDECAGLIRLLRVGEDLTGSQSAAYV